MRTLFLVRHAKSSWADAALRDHDRPLNDRGLRDAPFMADVFRDREASVDLIVSSTAVRAHRTALFFAAGLSHPPSSLRLEPAIYDASLNALMKVVNHLPDQAERVALFGHEPGFTELADHLTGAGITHIPTCGMVRIDFHLDQWSLVTRHVGMLVWSDHPKAHRGQADLP